MNCPRLVIAGTQSGAGKTSLALALAAALRRRGLRVQTFKAGPDFLDPTYLAAASGRPCYNLDGWMCGREYVAGLFARAVEGADLAVIEGVMGLFDGAEPAGIAGSTAEIARWLEAPVLLVVGARGAARSLAATVHGFASFEEGVKIGGVIANHCGTDRQFPWIAESLRARSLPPLLGAIPRGAWPQLPSRHLGLVKADADNLPAAALEALGSVLEAHSQVEELWRLARSAPPLPFSPPARTALPLRMTLGVAYDRAFHFYYPDLFDELKARGCRVIFFSPLSDRHLPEGIGALYLGGGYPEEHAAELAANEEMAADIRRFAASGRPVYGECGGLMYLSRQVERRDGKIFPMVGLLPAGTRMGGGLKALGYVEATMAGNSLWGEAGATLRGHEFHYSELTAIPDGEEGWQPAYLLCRRGGPAAPEGFRRGRVLASYVHLHLASRERAIESFLRNCGAEPWKER